LEGGRNGPARNRRAFLATAAKTAGVAVVGGLGWRAWDEGVLRAGQGAPYAPWERWQGSAHSSRDLVRAAILAASPHNSQPWAFRLTSGRIDVFADRGRNLGSIDPFLEEMDLGLGCAVANLIEAARDGGFAPRFELAPDDTDPNWVARIAVADPGRPRPAGDGLSAAIGRRHTNRGPYDRGRPLPGSALTELGGIARRDPRIGIVWLTAPADRDAFADLTLAATRAIVEDVEMSRDSAAWFRFDRDAIERHRDGITLDALGMPAWMRALAKMLPSPSVEEADARWIDSTRDVHLATAPAFGILAARDPDALEVRLKCGMAWQRMHLWATSRGIAMHPLNQVPERRNRERALSIEARFGEALATLVSDAALHPMLCFRLGWPEREALPSPRRPVDRVEIGGKRGES